MSAHRLEVTIRFSHCDPAGIVFYPRFFTLFNDTVEDWFTRGLGIDHATLFSGQRVGMPTAHLECDFRAPCFMGERLAIDLSVARIGTSSLHLCFAGSVDGAARLAARSVLVHTSLETHRPRPIPDDWRRRMAAYLAEDPMTRDGG